MKKQIFLILLILTAVVSWKMTGGSQIRSTVFAVGDLFIDWGVPVGDPIFVVQNMLPGDTETRNMVVTNNASTARPVAVRGDLLFQLPDDPNASFSSILDFTISENGTDVWDKMLADFFNETATPSSIPLSTIGPGETKTYTFAVRFRNNAGNEFQNARVIFNLLIGIDTDIPPECSEITFSGPAIYGTQAGETIHGTTGNDLIFALEGNDRVYAKTGDDCIVGGPGDDELRGENGKDIVFGNDGDDLVIGANGKDLLFGGSGNDTMRGENSNDYMEGNEGNDAMKGGNGNDEMYGNAGIDQADGENGNDFCDAETEVSCEL